MAKRSITADKVDSHGNGAASSEAELLAKIAPGSIAHMVSESPGGSQGALERVRAAKAAGVPLTAAILLGEGDLGAPKLTSAQKRRSIDDAIRAIADEAVGAGFNAAIVAAAKMHPKGSSRRIIAKYYEAIRERARSLSEAREVRKTRAA
jgi:hypothetical protein